MSSLFCRGLATLCILLIICMHSVQGSYVCPDGWILKEDKCYYFSTDIVTWAAANVACQGKSAQLVEIYDETENAFLLSMVRNRSHSFFWIGLTDVNQEGSFTWNSGNDLTYTNWSDSGPANNTDEDCLQMYWNVCVSGENGTSCESHYSNVCARDVQDSYFWIGLTDINSEGNFSWISLTFTNWVGGNSDDSGNEDCVKINWSDSTSGWVDDKCQSSNFYICERIAQDSDSCTEGTVTCDTNAVCTNLGDCDRCICNEGFSGDGTTCTDINECDEDTDNCAEDADCINTAGGFTCTCKWGLTGDGPTCSPQLQYGCYPDGSIHLYNLPEDGYLFAMQNVTQDIHIRCTVVDLNATTAKISGCAKDIPIIVTYSTYSGIGTYLLHGGGSVIVVMVTCLKISADGDAHTIRNIFNASLQLEQVVLEPEYQVTSSLSTTTVIVGNPVDWIIHYPDEYMVEVTSCTAHPGQDDSSPVHQISLITECCPINPQLITEFTYNQNGTSSAVIYGFSFYGYQYVYLTCKLKVCPAGTKACTTTCGSRKKRSVKERMTREPRGTFPASIANVLHILDYGSGTSRTASGISASTKLTLTFLLTLLALHIYDGFNLFPLLMTYFV